MEVLGRRNPPKALSLHGLMIFTFSIWLLNVLIGYLIFYFYAFAGTG